MSGIANLSIEQVRKKIKGFNLSYAKDWNQWRKCYFSKDANFPKEFGRILRKWQACRPNKMRCIREEANHPSPFLEDLIHQAENPLKILEHFHMGSQSKLSKEIVNALDDVWDIFKKLSYHGRSRNGLASVVGISKAVLLLTEGRVGPAFDRNVRKALEITHIPNAHNWISVLEKVSSDIIDFEKRNDCILSQICPKEYANENSGRLYDMIFGPREDKHTKP